VGLAARYAGPEHKLRRYEWGDALPPPAGDANLAGSEAAGSLPAVLDGWQDEYPSVAPVGKFAANFLGLQDMLGQRVGVGQRRLCIVRFTGRGQKITPDPRRAGRGT
jgi:hypothetical protein